MACARHTAAGCRVNRSQARPVPLTSPSQVLVGIEVLGQSVETRRRAVGMFLEAVLDLLLDAFLKIAFALRRFFTGVRRAAVVGGDRYDPRADHGATRPAGGTGHSPP